MGGRARRRRGRGCLIASGVGLGVIAVLLIGLVIAARLLDRVANPKVDPVPLPSVTQPKGATALAPGELLFDADGTGNFEIYVLDRASGARRGLTDDPAYDSWWARPSPDRTRILFYRTPAGVHDLDFHKTSLWMMSADGSDQVEVLPPGSHGWFQHGHAEWAPDGSRLVMFAGSRTNPQIYLTDDLGRDPQRLTDDGGVNLDPSWSPDGATIVYVGCPRALCLPGDQELYTIPVEGGARQRLTDDDVRDHDPYYSPDGATIAMLSQTEGGVTNPIGTWNIRAVPAAGGPVSDVTTAPGVTSLPRWADAGTLYTHRLVPDGTGFDLYRVDVASGRLEQVTDDRGNEEYPSP